MAKQTQIMREAQDTKYPPKYPYVLSAKDKELVRLAHNHLANYLNCLTGKLSPEAYAALSHANKVIWREMESQNDLLSDIYDTGVISTPEGWL
jgi:hypothetical protein